MDTSISMNTLCHQCQNINFDGLIREEPAENLEGRYYQFYPSYEIGSIAQLVQRKDQCGACRAFDCVIQELLHKLGSTAPEEGFVMLKLEEMPVAVVPGGKKDKVVFDLVLKVDVSSDPSHQKGQAPISEPFSFHFQAVTPSSILQLEDLKVAPARLRPAQCDFELLKIWLKQCEETHGIRCASGNPKSIPGFRLVDTQDRCIVDVFTLPRIPRYLALSYVWGVGFHSWTLTTDALMAARAIGFLDTIPVAATISDAIELVQRLAERYLWIDSLCIIQDSSEDQAGQIPRMGDIYGNAIATIVAASAEHANGGLPGVRPGTRRNTEPGSLQTDEVLLVPLSEPELEEPYWRDTGYWPIMGRKWTFQEDILSQRCLLFSKEQVLWRCRCTTWSEQMLLQPTKESTFCGWRAFCLLAQSINIKSIASVRDPDFLEMYEGLVQLYTVRSVTSASDAFHAFKGILSTINRLDGIIFLWALPQSCFDFFLLWRTKSKVSYRTEAPELPSWSWIAWEGESLQAHARCIPELECYVLDCIGRCSDLKNTPLIKVLPKTATVLRTLPNDPYGESKLPKRGWKPNNSAVVNSDIISLGITGAIFGGKHLFSWASIAPLFVCRQAIEPEDGDEDQEEIHLRLPAKINDVVTPNSSEAASEPNSSNKHLVTFKPGRQVNQWSLRDGPVPGPKESLHDFIMVGTDVGVDTGAELLIMMVSWREGIAHREYLTSISETAWMEAQRTWRLIVLG